MVLTILLITNLCVLNILVWLWLLVLCDALSLYILNKLNCNIMVLATVKVALMATCIE